MTQRSRLLLWPLLLVLPGCHRAGGAEGVVAARTSPGTGLAPDRQAAGPLVHVPSAVAARWTRMKLGVIDLQARKETTYVLTQGQDFTLPGSDLTVRPLALVPDFTLDNGVISSRTDAPNNPAAQVLVTEGGRQIFRGWLFSRFPENHPFEHPRFAIRLLDLEPQASR